MEKRIRKLRWQFMRHKGVDLIVSHAPVRGYGDDETVVHGGFEAFLKLLDKYKPRYWAYGHVHTRYGNMPRTHQRNETTLVNACERYMIEI